MLPLLCFTTNCRVIRRKSRSLARSRARGTILLEERASKQLQRHEQDDDRDEMIMIQSTLLLQLYLMTEQGTCHLPFPTCFLRPRQNDS